MGEFSCRILEYLEWAERDEQDVWLCDDIRQAYITVKLADLGDPHPFVTASYSMYGLPPEQLYPHILARRRAKLGKFYSAFWPKRAALLADPLTAKRRECPKCAALPQIPKKPAASERQESVRFAAISGQRKRDISGS